MVELVAELSGNHGGSIANAVELIRQAKICGADAVKFQCFDPERLAAKRRELVWDGRQFRLEELRLLYRKTHTPRDWFPTMIAQAALVGIPWFSSVFDPDDVAFLETLGCPRYKISAYEMLDGDLINAVKATGKPIVMSVRHQPGLTILNATDYATDIWHFLGVSDHTTKGSSALKPYAKLIPMVERHLRLPNVDTPDAAFSSTPEEFAAYVAAIRKAAA